MKRNANYTLCDVPPDAPETTVAIGTTDSTPKLKEELNQDKPILEK